jgi:hypothetical protein
VTGWGDETKTKDGRSYQYVVDAPVDHDETKTENIGDKMGETRTL